MRTLNRILLGTAATLAVAACSTNPAGTGSTPNAGMSAITGTVKFNGQVPPNPGSITIRLKTVSNGTSSETSNTTTLDSNGNYAFNNITPGSYQAFFKGADNATFLNQNINTVGYYNFAPVNPAANQSVAEPTVDLFWAANPQPTTTSNISMAQNPNGPTFSWTAKSGAAQYQLFVGTNNGSVFSSAWSSSTSAVWTNFQNQNTNAQAGPGTYNVQIKFADTTGGTGGAWGGTNNIPYNVTQ